MFTVSYLYLGSNTSGPADRLDWLTRLRLEQSRALSGSETVGTSVAGC